MQKKRLNRADDPRERELLGDLAVAKAELAHAYARFDNAVEPELIEASIYEINAQRARYSYLIRRLKERDAQTEEALTWG